MKYIIEFEDKPFIGANDRRLYKAKEFSALVFDEFGLKKLQTLNEYDENGWKITSETMQKIDDIKAEERAIGFNEGYESGYRQGCIDTEMKGKTIVCGDEVEAWDTNDWVRFIAWAIECDDLSGIDENGGSYFYPICSCRKTGKHYDITFAESEE